jgi:UTP:GlnB (protein PII) uridylyltransferase
LLELARRNEKQRRDAQRQSLFSDLYKTDPANEQDTDASSLEVSNRIQTIILNETTRILADALISIKTANSMTGIVSDGTRSTGNTQIPVTQ